MKKQTKPLWRIDASTPDGPTRCHVYADDQAHAAARAHRYLRQFHTSYEITKITKKAANHDRP